jgi:hypothetical protein
MNDLSNAVGPVLVAGELANHLVAAIRTLNRLVVVQEHGSYVRISVPFSCNLTRSAVEKELGRPFAFPDDLEPIMPSFKGLLTVSSEEVRWVFMENRSNKA